MFQSGAVIRPEDPRDIELGRVQAPTKIPSIYIPDMEWFTRHYQGPIPACGAFAHAHFKQIVQHYDDSAIQVPISPSFSWREIKLIDNIKPEDGTSDLAIFKVDTSKGALEYGKLNESISQSLEDYTDSTPITPEMEEEANVRIGNKYAFVRVPDFEDVKQAIWNNKACILLLRGDNGFWETTETSFNIIKWGHFAVAYGWDETGIWIVDSAEREDKYGFKHIDKKYFPSQFCVELGTSIDLADSWVKMLISKWKLVREVAYLCLKLVSLKGRN